MAKVAIVMGSKNDLPVVQPAIDILNKFDIGIEVRVLSAHRVPDDVKEFVVSCNKNGTAAIIAAAGKAAHLAGVCAAYTVLPVIGLPVQSSLMGGLDSLLSMVQMPDGVPVATVAVNGAKNAGILAAQIIAVADKELTKKLRLFKKDMADKVLADDKELQSP